jgi:hypothetical protein
MGEVYRQNYTKARAAYLVERRKDWAIAIGVLVALMGSVVLILTTMNGG